MAQFSVDAKGFDPYKNFKFRIKWDERYVAGFSKASALKRTLNVIDHRKESIIRKSSGQKNIESITLEQGVTHDLKFEKWANKVWNYDSDLGAQVSLKDFRKNMIIEVYNEAGQLAITCKVYRCWISEFTAIPELDASGNVIAIHSMKLETEGWEIAYRRESTEPGLS